jgi:hypothetical protein
MDYPGRNIKVGEQDANIVRTLKMKLNELLVLEHDPSLRLDPNNPNFGPRMRQTIKLFQARNVDMEGRPLVQDGVVGALTWAALFGKDTVPITTAASDQFLNTVIKIAAGEEAKHVVEVPLYSNRGPEVDAYLRRAGTDPPAYWCCAFVYWCFDEASKKLGCSNPMVKTAVCLDHWKRSVPKGAKRIPAQEAIDNPALVKPGMVFIVDHGGGNGHTGLVEKASGALLTTIEGNTNTSGSANGYGVFRRTQKSPASTRVILITPACRLERRVRLTAPFWTLLAGWGTV